MARWKCLECGKTFTAYPPFASPYKRYALDDILRLSSKYIQDEQQTYYTVVTHEGSSIGYEEENKKNVDHFLAPSTLWRWIRWSGTTQVSIDVPGAVYYIFMRYRRQGHF